MKLGIIAALQQEFKTLIKGHNKLHQPVLLKKNISGIISGMGPENAKQAAHILTEKFPEIEAIISWGVAAGISPDLRTGDVVLPKHVIPVGAESMEINNPLLISLEQKLSKFSFVKLETRLAGTEELLIDAAAKKKLHQHTFAHVADMETAALFKFARTRDLNFAAIRAISDTSYDELPQCIANYTNQDGSVQLGGLLSEIVTNPVQWKHLIKVGMNFRKARKHLSIISAIVLNR